MESAQKIAEEFIKENEDELATLGLCGIVSGMSEKEYESFAQFCKQKGISKQDAIAALEEFVGGK
jgi:hypothetical protein